MNTSFYISILFLLRCSYIFSMEKTPLLTQTRLASNVEQAEKAESSLTCDNSLPVKKQYPDFLRRWKATLQKKRLAQDALERHIKDLEDPFNNSSSNNKACSIQ